MKAIIRSAYGAPDVVKLVEVDKPAPAGDQLLVKVRAAAVNPLDWHFVRGTPYLMRLAFGVRRPKSPRLGADFAGTVEGVGSHVVRFKPGDEVFGAIRGGAFAEYVTVPETGGVALKPPGISFEQAAAVPVAGLTALQSLRDRGEVRPGQQVLIHGASGGVGTFALQIAKSLGAEVTAVCGSRNVDLVRSLGASHVIDYAKEDFAAGVRQYDVLLDNVGNRSLSECRRVLKPRGIYVGAGAGGPDDMLWGFSMIGRMIRSLILTQLVGQKLRGVHAHMNEGDLIEMGRLTATGQVTPVIDRRYCLSDVPGAIRYLETCRARGKVIITM